MSLFLKIEFIQTQILKHCRPINDFFDLTCTQIKLQSQSTKAAFVALKLLTKLFSQQFVLKANQGRLL